MYTENRDEAARERYSCVIAFAQSALFTEARCVRGRLERWLDKLLQAGEVMNSLHFLAYVSQNGQVEFATKYYMTHYGEVRACLALGKA
jgi:hypothetical protein